MKGILGRVVVGWGLVICSLVSSPSKFDWGLHYGEILVMCVSVYFVVHFKHERGFGDG